MSRHDMLVELASDQVNQIQQMILDGDYDDVHKWLHPILLANLKLEVADFEDKDLKRYYESQLGVDLRDEDD